MKWRGCAIWTIFAALLLTYAARGGEWDGVAFEQPAPAEMRCWFVLPTRLVPDDADLPSDRKAHPFELRAGRNECECAQLVILRAQPAAGISVQFSEFTSEGGATIPASSCRANKVGQIPGTIATRAPKPIATWDMIAPDASQAAVTPAMYSPSAATVVPDRLLADDRFDLGVGLTRIWLTVRVPKDATPGLYRGAVRLLKPDGELLHEIPLPLRVWNYSLPDQPTVVVMADVAPTTRPAQWKDLQPLYDDLKAHRINATGEVLPPLLWRSDQPPPETDEYEAALKYVLDELGFVRFRFPGGQEISDAMKLEPTAKAGDVGDGIWITDTHTDRIFDNPYDTPVTLWLQADVRDRAERKIVSIDGKVVGTIGAEEFLSHPLRFATLPQPIEITPGRHALRIETEGTVDHAEPAAVEAIFLSPQQEPDFEKLLRERVALSPASRDLLAFHTDQVSDWLRARGWLKKAQIRTEARPFAPADFARVAVTHDFLGQAIPMVRRELSAMPSPPLRKLVEVWTPDLLALAEVSDDTAPAVTPGQELWASHATVHAIGHPPLAIRLIPWAIARHELHGYDLGVINKGPNALIDSIRFELLREGLEDFEMLRMLRTSMDAAIGRGERDSETVAALERGEKLFSEGVPALIRSAREFSWDPTAVQAARDEAGELLSILTKP